MSQLPTVELELTEDCVAEFIEFEQKLEELKIRIAEISPKHITMIAFDNWHPFTFARELSNPSSATDSVNIPKLMEYYFEWERLANRYRRPVTLLNAMSVNCFLQTGERLADIKHQTSETVTSTQ